MLRIGWEAWPIIYMTTSRNAILTNLDWCLLLLLHLLVYLLRSLMAGNVHAFLLLGRYQNVLIWIWILPRKESPLGLPFSTFLNHSFLGSRTLAFCNVADGFEISYHIEALTSLSLWVLLLLSNCLFKLKLLLHLDLFVSKNWVLTCLGTLLLHLL